MWCKVPIFHKINHPSQNFCCFGVVQWRWCGLRSAPRWHRNKIIKTNDTRLWKFLRFLFQRRIKTVTFAQWQSEPGGIMAGVWNNYSSASAWQLLIKFIIKFKWTDYAEATIAIPHEVQSDYNARVIVTVSDILCPIGRLRTWRV